MTISCYAAHIVMVVRFKDRSQRRVPAWENVVLLQATSDESATSKAEAIGAAGAGDEDGSFTWGGKPASWEFAGVRKVTECALSGPKPASGDEITYSELEFESLAAARRFARGGAVSTIHTDQIADADDTAEAAAKPKRKLA